MKARFLPLAHAPRRAWHSTPRYLQKASASASAPSAAPSPSCQQATATAGHPNNPKDAPRLSPLFTPLKGKHILEEPILNKGSAFTQQERDVFHLNYYLPCEIDPLELQLKRAESQLRDCPTALSQYSFLRSMRDQNQILFYALLQRNLRETLPIIYTPTVGEAIKQFSHIFRRADGLFLSYPHFKEGGAAYLHGALTDHEALSSKSIDLIVCTDSEGILGIGDWGVGGIGIVVGKQVLYTLGAGIDPNRCLNIVLDSGTDNSTLLDDDLYLGWRHNRVRGKEYDEFVDTFVAQAAKTFPDALIHFEDFGNANANRLLQKFQPKYSVFNDDIQGTGAAALAALLSAIKVTGSSLKDQTIVLSGAGTAGLGITNRIRDAMMQTEGLSKEEANKRLWLIDRYGLIHEGQDNIREGQAEFARSSSDVQGFASKHDNGQYSLYDTVKAVKPTVLIGTSTMARSFTEEIVREMSSNVDRPIILPISNPTNLCEVDPRDAIQWSEGRALVATGSPSPPAEHPKTGEKIRNAELNNALIFPALGLGTILSKSARLTDSMIVAGVDALASLSPAIDDPAQGLLPRLEEVRSVSITVAAAVMRAARKEGQAKGVEEWPDDDDGGEKSRKKGEAGGSSEQTQTQTLEEWIEERMWKPVYRPLEPVQTAV